MSKSTTDFFALVFGRAEYEQDELADRWKMLDTKAQSTASMAGVIMAAAFVLVRNTNLQIPFLAQLLLILLLLTLAAVIGWAVWSMRIITVSLPMTTEEVAKMVRQAIDRPTDEYERRYDGLLADTMEAWVRALAESHEAVQRKARSLALAQVFLLVSVALAVGLIAVTVVVGKTIS